MFKQTMTFCNKGVVRADPPPVMVKDHIFTFFLGPFPNKLERILAATAVSKFSYPQWITLAGKLLNQLRGGV